MPGHLFSSLRGHLDDFWSQCQIFLKKVSSPTPPKGVDFGTFFDLFFNRFFGVLSFLDFYAFACPKGPFWLSFRLLFESPGLWKKQLKVCNCRRFSRTGPFRMRLFLKIWSWVGFDVDFFRFFRFLMIFGVSNLIDFRAKITIKKKSQKRVNEKNRKNGKNENWEPGPLKREQKTQIWQLTSDRIEHLTTQRHGNSHLTFENRTSDNPAINQTRQACLAARWRIVN